MRNFKRRLDLISYSREATRNQKNVATSNLKLLQIASKKKKKPNPQSPTLLHETFLFVLSKKRRKT